MYCRKNIVRNLIFVFLLSVFMFLPVELLAAGKVKIGVINLDRAGRESERGKKMVEIMKLKVMKEQGNIRKQDLKLQELRDEISKQGLIMSEEIKRKKETEYRIKSRALERQKIEAQEEIQIKQMEVSSIIMKELKEIIREIGKKGGYTYIAPYEITVYSDETIDITNKVIREYNKKYLRSKGEKKNKLSKK